LTLLTPSKASYSSEVAGDAINATASVKAIEVTNESLYLLLFRVMVFLLISGGSANAFY
jgi:hypothetical protein